MTTQQEQQLDFLELAGITSGGDLLSLRPDNWIDNKNSHAFDYSDPHDSGRCVWCDCRPWGGWSQWPCQGNRISRKYRKALPAPTA